MDQFGVYEKLISPNKQSDETEDLFGAISALKLEDSISDLIQKKNESLHQLYIQKGKQFSSQEPKTDKQRGIFLESTFSNLLQSLCYANSNTSLLQTYIQRAKYYSQIDKTFYALHTALDTTRVILLLTSQSTTELDKNLLSEMLQLRKQAWKSLASHMSYIHNDAREEFYRQLFKQEDSILESITNNTPLDLAAIFKQNETVMKQVQEYSILNQNRIMEISSTMEQLYDRMRDHFRIDSSTSALNEKGIFSKRLFAKNEIIFQEAPFAFVLHRNSSPELRLNKCHNCFMDMNDNQESYYPFVSTDFHQSSSAMEVFCSELCRSEYWNDMQQYFKEWEIFFEVFSEEQDKNMATDVLLAIAILLKSKADLKHSKLYDIIGGDYKKRIENLMHHKSKQHSSIMENVTLHAEKVIQIAEHYKLTIPFAKEEFIDMLLKIRCNAIAITQQRTSNALVQFVSSGKGLYLLSSFLNHSCAPNCKLHFQGNVVYLITTREVRPNEELTISYGPQRFSMSKEKRQTELMNQYFFQCKCSACSSTQSEEMDQKKLLSYKSAKLFYERGNDKAKLIDPEEEEPNVQICAEAIKYLHEAIRIQKQNGLDKYAEHRYEDFIQLYGSTNDKLAFVYNMLGQFSECLQYSAVACRMAEIVYGETSLEVCLEYEKLARLLLVNGDVDNAYTYVELALSILSSQPSLVKSSNKSLWDSLKQFRTEIKEQYEVKGMKAIQKCKFCKVTPIEQKDLALKRCSKCQQVSYCSRECQLADWSVHKLSCVETKKK